MNEVINSKKFRQGESPSFGAAASARGMAKLAAAMANRGEVRHSSLFQILSPIWICCIFALHIQIPGGGSSLISAETWDLMHGNPVKRLDAAFFLETNFSQGGVNFYG